MDEKRRNVERKNDFLPCIPGFDRKYPLKWWKLIFTVYSRLWPDPTPKPRSLEAIAALTTTIACLATTTIAVICSLRWSKFRTGLLSTIAHKPCCLWPHRPCRRYLIKYTTWQGLDAYEDCRDRALGPSVVELGLDAMWSWENSHRSHIHGNRYRRPVIHEYRDPQCCLGK